MSNKYHNTTTADADRDYWRTPTEIYTSLNNHFKFDVDLACTTDNCLAPLGLYYDAGFDSLAVTWSDFGRRGWCNPPYSDINPWLEKAIAERNKFTSVFLIPMPNGEKRDSLIFEASRLYFIRGRVAFINNNTGKPVSGNTRGSVICVYDNTKTRQSISVKRQSIIDGVAKIV